MKNIKDNIQLIVNKKINKSSKQLKKEIQNKQPANIIFNNIKKFLLQIFNLLKVDKKQKQTDKLYKQITEVLQTIRKSLSDNNLYSQQQDEFTEITINTFLSSFKNQITQSLLEHTLNIDKHIKKILKNKENKNIKNFNIQKQLQSLYDVYSKNLQYVQGIINKYNSNAFSPIYKEYSTINNVNQQLLKHIDSITYSPEIKQTLYNKKIQSLTKKKYVISQINTKKIDTNISQNYQQLSNQIQYNILENLQKLVINTNLNQTKLNIQNNKSNIKKSIKQLSKQIQHTDIDTTDNKPNDLILNKHTNNQIIPFFTLNKSYTKPEITQIVKGIAQIPKIKNTSKTIQHTKETTEKIYQLLSTSFNEANIFEKLFGSKTPQFIQEKLDSTKKQSNQMQTPDMPENQQQQQQQQQQPDKETKYPWFLFGLLMRGLRLLGRAIRSLWNRFRNRPRYKPTRPKMKLKPGDWKKMMLRKGMTIANVNKLEKALFKAKKAIEDAWHTKKVKTVEECWDNLIKKDPRIKSQIKNMDSARFYKFKKEWCQSFFNQLSKSDGQLTQIIRKMQSHVNSIPKGAGNQAVNTVENWLKNIINPKMEGNILTAINESNLFKLSPYSQKNIRWNGYKIANKYGIKIDSYARLSTQASRLSALLNRYNQQYANAFSKVSRLQNQLKNIDDLLKMQQPGNTKLLARAAKLRKQLQDATVELSQASMNLANAHDRGIKLVRRYGRYIQEPVYENLRGSIKAANKNAVSGGRALIAVYHENMPSFKPTTHNSALFKTKMRVKWNAFKAQHFSKEAVREFLLKNPGSVMRGIKSGALKGLSLIGWAIEGYFYYQGVKALSDAFSQQATDIINDPSLNDTARNITLKYHNNEMWNAFYENTARTGLGAAGAAIGGWIGSPGGPVGILIGSGVRLYYR